MQLEQTGFVHYAAHVPKDTCETGAFAPAPGKSTIDRRLPVGLNAPRSAMLCMVVLILSARIGDVGGVGSLSPLPDPS